MISSTVLRQRQVLARLQISKTTLYALIKSGQFKRPFSLGARAVGWFESDVSEFLESRAQARAGNARFEGREGR